MPIKTKAKIIHFVPDYEKVMEDLESLGDEDLLAMSDLLSLSKDESISLDDFKLESREVFDEETKPALKAPVIIPILKKDLSQLKCQHCSKIAVTSQGVKYLTKMGGKLSQPTPSQINQAISSLS